METMMSTVSDLKALRDELSALAERVAQLESQQAVMEVIYHAGFQDGWDRSPRPRLTLVRDA